jgi:hypothetical protein
MAVHCVRCCLSSNKLVAHKPNERACQVGKLNLHRLATIPVLNSQVCICTEAMSAGAVMLLLAACLQARSGSCSLACRLRAAQSSSQTWAGAAPHMQWCVLDVQRIYVSPATLILCNLQNVINGKVCTSMSLPATRVLVTWLGLLHLLFRDVYQA